MKNLWHVLRGILIALVSVGLLFGGLSLSLAENRVQVPPTPTQLSSTLTFTLPASPTPTARASSTGAGIHLPSVTPAQTPTFNLTLPSPTSTLTLPPTPTNCPPPSGWVPYAVKTGDTLASLSTRHKVSVASLKSGNCLTSSELVPGSIIYVPPSPTHTRIPCGPPAGWILTVVQAGDTLFHFSQAYGVSVDQLQLANCMGNSTLLRLGQSFYVPPWATRTPTFSFPAADTPTFVPTDTFIVDTPTSTTEPVFNWTNTPPDYTPPFLITP